MKTRRKNYSLTDSRKKGQDVETSVKGRNTRNNKISGKQNYSHSSKIKGRKHDELAQEKRCKFVSTAKSKTRSNDAKKNYGITLRKERKKNPSIKRTKPETNKLQKKFRKENVKQNSSNKTVSNVVKNKRGTVGKGKGKNSTKVTKSATSKLKSENKNLKDLKEKNTLLKKDSDTIMESKSPRKQKQEKNTKVKSSDVENMEVSSMEQLEGSCIVILESIPPEKHEVNDAVDSSNINKDRISNDETENNDDILRRESGNVELKHEEKIEATSNNYIETEIDFSMEPVKEKRSIQEAGENNMETPETSEKNDKDMSDDSDPEEITFCHSREEAMESLKLVKSEITKIKQERKEMRKKIQDRNVLQKKHKKDKADEIRKRKLPPELLEYVSKFPRINENDRSGQIKQQEAKSIAVDEDEKGEEFMNPLNEDFISLHGSTEFRACHLDKMIKKPKSVAASIADFKQRAFLGNKRNKRESVWEIKSKMIKQAAGGKL